MGQSSRRIHVDLSAVQRFADRLQINTEQELKPGAARAGNEIQKGTRVGQAFPGGDTAAARQMLTHAVMRATDNIVRHVRAAEILAMAIKRALENYAASDQDAADRVARIEDVLLEALSTANIVVQSPGPLPSTGFQP